MKGGHTPRSRRATLLLLICLILASCATSKSPAPVSKTNLEAFRASLTGYAEKLNDGGAKTGDEKKGHGGLAESLKSRLLAKKPYRIIKLISGFESTTAPSSTTDEVSDGVIFATGTINDTRAQAISLGYVQTGGRLQLCAIEFSRSRGKRVGVIGHRLLGCSDRAAGAAKVPVCASLSEGLDNQQRSQWRALRQFSGGNWLHLLRAIYPLHMDGFRADGRGGDAWDEVRGYLSDLGARPVLRARELVYGDLLWRGHPLTKVVNNPSPGYSLGIYLGHGLEARLISGRLQIGPLRADYSEALRLIPAFAECDYEAVGGSFLRRIVPRY